MLVSKICLTGGPCAGKSTALAKIERELTDLGYKVFIIDEVATRLINRGIKPFGDDSIDMFEFEQIMLKHQLKEEETFEKVCNMINKKCVIICDRGIFDIKSFLTNKEFDKLLKQNNLSKLSLMDNYNLVIHMTTAAKGAEKFYTTDNNKVRTEGIKEAIIRDDKCMDAWSFHNNLKIVDNSTSFDEKIEKVINNIKSSLGIENRKQRKYLVEIKENDNEEIVKVDITQYYLETNNDYEIRLRKRTLDGDDTYYITIKNNNNEKEKVITEEKIDKKTFERLLNQRMVINTVEKQRICFTYHDNLFKLDRFNDGMIILETDGEVAIPPYIKVIKEVSLDKNYKNMNIKIGGDKNDLRKRRRCYKKV